MSELDRNLRDFIVKTIVAELAGRPNTDHEARGAVRDLRQIIESHERLHQEAAKYYSEQVHHANEQRERIEKKLDNFIDEFDRKETRMLIALIGILLAALAFFLIPYFRGN